MIVNKNIRFLIALILALLLLLFWGTAVAKTQLQKEVIVRVGENVTVTENQVVTEATAIGASVILEKNAHVTGNTLALGGDVVLKAGSKVDGDATAVGGKITQQEGAMVAGEAVSVPQISHGITHIMRHWGIWGMLARFYLFNAAIYLLFILALTIIGVVFLLLMPNSIQSVATTISQAPLKSLGYGLGSAIAFLLLTILTGGSLLGAVLIPISLLALGIAKLLGIVSMGLVMGKTSWKKLQAPVGQFLVGMVILGVISLIPVVGGLIFLLLSLFGLGGVLASPLVTEIYRRFRYRTKQSASSEIMHNQQQEML
jgi:hypothetical protein